MSSFCVLPELHARNCSMLKNRVPFVLQQETLQTARFFYLVEFFFLCIVAGLQFIFDTSCLIFPRLPVIS